jgi:heterodisulfide reductase subunit A
VSHNENWIQANELVNTMVNRVESHPHVKVYTSAEIEAIQGYIGNYNVTLKSNGSNEVLDVSTIIVATGMKEIAPTGWYDYGENPSVISQLQLEELINRDEVDGFKDVVMINCVNSKNEFRGCCNIGCHISVKNALVLKEQNHDMRVSILYRDLSMVKDERSY